MTCIIGNAMRLEIQIWNSWTVQQLLGVDFFLKLLIYSKNVPPLMEAGSWLPGSKDSNLGR
jgi:hypothetical protein